MNDVHNRYLELLKGCLTRTLFLEKGAELDKRELGLDWPEQAETMIGVKRLDNIRHCIESIIEDKIEGDMIECGVWRGGSCIWMNAILHTYNEKRNVFVADSFNGFPKPKYEYDSYLNFLEERYLKVSKSEVENNFKKYGLLDEQIQFIEGYFSDTLPKFNNKLALLRADGDLFESTMDILNNLYDKVSIGGYIIIDDYQIDQCQVAVQLFRSNHKVTDKLEIIEGNVGAFWRKTK